MSLSCGSDGVFSVTIERIRQAHDRMLTIDAHVVSDIDELFLSGMEEGDLDAAFFAISAPDPRLEHGLVASARADVRLLTLDAIRAVKSKVQGRSEQIDFALAAEDAYRLEKQGRRAAYLAVEYDNAMGANLSLVTAYHREGARMLTLCGVRDNVICDSAYDQISPEDEGLSEFGRQIIAECNRLGMIIDVANCSERSIREVLDASQAPVVASRTATRDLCARPGNLSDDLIRAITGRAGAILISFAPERLATGECDAHGRRAAVSDIADHLEHAIKIGGIDGVGIASGFGDGGGVAGCRDASEILSLTLELLRRGYGEHDVESIWGGNLMRVFDRVEAQAPPRSADAQR